MHFKKEIKIKILIFKFSNFSFKINCISKILILASLYYNREQVHQIAWELGHF